MQHWCPRRMRTSHGAEPLAVQGGNLPPAAPGPRSDWSPNACMDPGNNCTGTNVFTVFELVPTDAKGKVRLGGQVLACAGARARRCVRPRARRRPHLLARHCTMPPHCCRAWANVPAGAHAAMALSWTWASSLPALPPR